MQAMQKNLQPAKNMFVATTLVMNQTRENQTLEICLEVSEREL